MDNKLDIALSKLTIAQNLMFYIKGTEADLCVTYIQEAYQEISDFKAMLHYHNILTKTD